MWLLMEVYPSGRVGVVHISRVDDNDAMAVRSMQNNAMAWNNNNKVHMDDYGVASHDVFAIRRFVIHSSELPLFVVYEGITGEAIHGG